MRTYRWFRKELRLAGLLFRYFIVSVSLFVLYYVLIWFFVDTDVEAALQKENAMYEAEYGELVRKETMVADVVALLEEKDNAIYNDIFHADSPSPGTGEQPWFQFARDTVQAGDIQSYVAVKADSALAAASRVEENFSAIAALLSNEETVVPPMSAPLETMDYATTGASMGQRSNPFYQVKSEHGGLDLLAQQGDAVFATADGVVSDVQKTMNGQGNVICIKHNDGFETRYAHLSEILVSKGEKVHKGRKIGSVGMTGGAYVPHLHYEVLKDGQRRDPVQYLFGSCGPDLWSGILFMSVSTGQSLD